MAVQIKSALFSVPLWGGILLATSVSAEVHQVRIVTDYNNLKMYFDPKSLKIARGDTVEWINEVDEEHNVISYPGGVPQNGKGFSSPFLTKAGETFSFTFNQVGTYQYHCIPHLLMGMNAEIIVERHSSAEEFHIPTRIEVTAYRDLLLEWFDEDDNLMRMRVDE